MGSARHRRRRRQLGPGSAGIAGERNSGISGLNIGETDLAGTLVCILYSSIFYTLAVHFNQLFFVSCGLLGFSFHGIVGSLGELPVKEIAARYGPRAPVKTTAIVLLIFSLLTAVQWLQQIVPALRSGRPPQEVVETGLFTHPAAVLDLSTFPPALFICA